MSVIQKFEYTWPDGTTQIEFFNWIDTLTQEEQDEFRLADIRQKEFRKVVIDQGNLTVTNNVYVWKDKDSLNTGKPTDPTWQMYWDRWQTETGVQFIIEQIET